MRVQHFANSTSVSTNNTRHPLENKRYYRAARAAVKAGVEAYLVIISQSAYKALRIREVERIKIHLTKPETENSVNAV